MQFQNGHKKIADKIDKLIREYEVRNIRLYVEQLYNYQYN